jgi:hypothetical protein
LLPEERPHCGNVLARICGSLLMDLGNARSRAGARASTSRLMKRRDVRAAIQWFYAQASSEIPRDEPMPKPLQKFGQDWPSLAATESSKTRSSYGSETSISLVLDDTGLAHLSFSSPEQARAWIRRIVGRKDYFGRNESTRSTYTVTKVGSVRVGIVGGGTDSSSAAPI